MIIDPIFAYVPSGQDVFRPSVIRPILSFLKSVAETGKTAIIILRHLTKAKHDKAIYQGGGSMDLIGAARSAFRVADHPEDEGIKLVLHVKHNIAVRGRTWVYKLVADKESQIVALEWVGPPSLTINDLMGTPNSDWESGLEKAKEFLRDYLKDGPQPSRAVDVAAEARSFSKKTIERARKEIGVKSRKKGKSWQLSLHDAGKTKG